MHKHRVPSPHLSVAMIGDHLPRKCGIATFTNDLSDALTAELPKDLPVEVVVMDDIPEGYDYPDRIRFQVAQNNMPDYVKAADYVNINAYDVAILQHEYGIFGGDCGAYILRMLKRLQIPVIATLHTILTEPSEQQHIVMRDLGRICERLIVMSKKAEGILKSVYDVDPNKVVYIPHGIPDVPLRSTSYFKQQFGFSDRKVVLTFGLLSPDKGIEHMIDAMPEVVKRHPDVTYIILGATHPHIIRHSGEAYRTALQQRVHKNGVAEHVQFVNQFVDLETLTQYLGAADIYVTPYLKEAQITSGTLSYAMGAGAATISTPYWFASEMLAEGRGRLCPFANASALAHEINALLDDPAELTRVRMDAYTHTRPMVWKEVARSYLQVCEEVIAERADKPRPATMLSTGQIRDIQELPEINLDHLRNMTDDTGLLQHAVYTVPDRFHGYCIDDNTRALIVVAEHYELYKDESVIPLMKTYLSFMHYAFNSETRQFRNFMGYDRQWLEDSGSEDSQARALWGLGVMVRCAPNTALRTLASRLFQDGMPACDRFEYPRAWAFALVGLHEYLAVFGGDSSARRLRNELARKLGRIFKKNAVADWPWCEDMLTYANARLPHALILSGQWMPKPEFLKQGLSSLKWLFEQQLNAEGHLSIIGNEKWMQREGDRSIFDQQPIEAMSMVEACLEAYRSTSDQYWHDAARTCYEWFLGRNDLNVPMCDFRTGGCFDGLEASGPNANQGAESTLAWLMSLLAMHKILGDETLIDDKGKSVSKVHRG